MALGETANLIVQLGLEDNLTAPLAQTGAAVDKLDVNVRSLHTRFREFGRIGSEVSLVMSGLGDVMGKEAGEAIRFAADVGLITTGLADLGPAALKGAQGILGLGTAAATATPEVAALGAATDSLAVGPLAKLVQILQPFVQLGETTAGAAAEVAVGVVAVGAAAQAASTNFGTFKASADYTKQSLGELHDELVSNQNTLVSFIDAVSTSSRDTDKLGDSIKYASDQTQHWHDLMDGLDGSVQAVAGSAVGLGAGINDVDANIQSATDATQAFANALDNLDRRRVDITLAFSVVGLGAAGLGALGNAADPLHPLTSDASNPNVVFDPATGKVITVGGPTGAFGNRPDPTKAIKDHVKATKDAYAEIAATIRDRYQTAKQLEDQYFQQVHQNNLKAIQEELDKARAQHTAAIQAIQDALATQLALNAQPVTAAQLALTNVQNQETLRNLMEAANAAFTTAQQNPNDPQAQIALRDAREALANFKAQLNINELQQKQAVADAKAKHDADVATAAANKALADANAKAQHDTVVENGRYATQQRNFNNAMQRILDDTVKKHQSLNTALQRLIDLIDRYAGKPLPTKDTQTGKTGESIHVVNVNVPPITIGARAVSNAMSTQINPSQTPFVRSGQVRPKFSPGN